MGAPSVRLFVLSDLAGALEPCGCVKDQLGGLDHLGALVQKEKSPPKENLVVAVGPTFFMDPVLTDEKRAQDTAKAHAIAKTLKGLGLVAAAPAKNEWAAGAAEIAGLAAESGAPMLAGNLKGAPSSIQGSTIRESGGLKIGFVGVSLPENVPGVTFDAAATFVKSESAALLRKGADLVIALAATGRGEAKRIADEVPELFAVVVGQTGGQGEANTSAPPAERIGDVLVVQTANHGQSVAVIDLYVRDPKAKKGALRFADGTGIERIKKKEELARRIDELRVRIAVWEANPEVQKADVEARRAEMTKLEAERDALDRTPPPNAPNFYRYAMREVRADFGKDEAVEKQMLAFYKYVNDANKTAFKDRKPKQAGPKEASYVGVETCSTCHEEPRKVWDKSAHAHAYKTLSDQFKEYNLDCVSCHVTGYDKPGGSTVTYVSELKDVQCEVCHGPGSLHVKNPDKVSVPIKKPGGDVCTGCHHPPHVHEFDATAKMELVRGPGHGKPLK